MTTSKDAAVIEVGLDVGVTADATIDFSYQGKIAFDGYDRGLDARPSVKF